MDKIINSFDVWIGAQGLKSQGQLKKIDNVSLDGIAKLREIIIEMAVHGKLVPQDSNDEPVQTLLGKIQIIKDKLIQNGELKKQNLLPEISDEDKPFAIPRTWQFVRLGDVTNYGSREQVDPDEISEEEWVLELEDVEKVTSKLLQRIYAKDRPPRSSRNRFFRGDVIYGKLRPYLDKVIVADADGVCTTEMIPFKGYHSISSEYLRLLMKSPFFVKYASESTHGMNLPRLGTDKARLAVIPIAPVNEQHRIVAKVGELMALCDELEKQETHHLKSHQLLVETLLSTLTQANDAAEFQTAWTRLAQHFDDIFTTEDSIDQLKQTILQLAVMGKLVPQDPNDEPASELLKRIGLERKKLANGKKPIQIDNSTIKQEEEFLELPRNWAWCRFGELIRFMAYGTSQKTNDNSENVPVLRMGNITTEGKLIYDNLKYINPDHEDLPGLYLEDGDIVFNRTNSFELVGKSAVYDQGPNRYTLASYLIKVSPFLKLTNSDYLNLYINSPLCRSTQIEPQITAQTNQANFSGSKLKNIIVPLPPLQEQSLIVIKANELIALCDRLKERIAKSQKITNELANSILSFV